jgi:hypothetical protein
MRRRLAPLMMVVVRLAVRLLAVARTIMVLTVARAGLARRAAMLSCIGIGQWQRVGAVAAPVGRRD